MNSAVDASPSTVGEVLYAERWNEVRRTAIRDSWLTENEARRRHIEGELFLAIDARRDDVGELRPRWVMGIGRSGVRVQFFTPGGGSIRRLIDYDARDGRLWRWITIDYVYPDDETFHEQFECRTMYTSSFEPDGTGTVDIDDKAKPMVDRARLTDAPVAGFWMGWPEFGHWDQLADPEYGVPPRATGDPVAPTP